MELRDLWYRVKTLTRLKQAERELTEEFAFHLDMERQKLMSQGFSEQQADEEARRRFGGLTRESQRARDSWGIGLMRDLASDVRHAFRQFGRRPAFTIAGTLTLAIGVGATVSLFSVVRGTLLRPLPVAHESELRVFWHPYDWRGTEYDYLRPRTKAFTQLAAFSINGYALGLEDQTVTTLASVVTAEIFDVLGAHPAIGRTFVTGDDRPGAEPKVVLGYRLWKNRFGGDSTIVGRTILLDNKSVTVTGVMPKGFYFPTPEVEMWRPLNLDPNDPQYRSGWLAIISRVKPGLSEKDVAADIRTMAADLGTQFVYPAAWDKTKNAGTQTLREYLQGNVRPALLLLLGAVVLLLLMACANVAALVLSRTADRQPEMILRTALGAGRGRLARQIVAESLALSTTSGVIGAALAAVSFGVLVNSLPLRDGLNTTLTLDWSMFAVAISLAAVVGLFVSAAPVRSVLMGDLKGVGSERSAQGLRGHKRFHSAMVAAEMTLGVTLAAGALLLVRSVAHVYAQDTGFDPRGVVTLDVLSPRGMAPDARVAFINTLQERARSIPGITQAGFVSRLPVRDGGWQGTVPIESRPDIAAKDAPNSFFRFITPGYFKTMGIDIVKGRDFTDADRNGALEVAIISEQFAKKMFPGKDPLGQRVGGPEGRWRTIVGIAEETRLFQMVGENPFCMYLPTPQNLQYAQLVLVAKTTGDQGTAMTALRNVVRDVDKRAAVGRVIGMEDVVKVSMSDRLQLRFFLSLFAGLAILLGAIGVYGVVSYAVSRRKAEFGVRMALGASSSRVMREVAGNGLIPVASGVVVGVVASVLLSRFVATFLYGVTQRDVISIGGAAVALMLAGVLAVLIPGFRAGKTSPMEVLRSE